MGVSHKVFVSTPVSNALDVYQDVFRAISGFRIEKYEKIKEDNGYAWFDIPDTVIENLKSPSIIAHSFDMFRIVFGTGVTHHQLCCFHTCSSDHSDVCEGEKLIFDIGCSGEHIEIMNVVKKAIAKYGDVYEVINDCYDEWVKCDE